MTSEKDPKVAAAKCLESVALDPENYRIGHTKASHHPRRDVPNITHFDQPCSVDGPAFCF